MKWINRKQFSRRATKKVLMIYWAFATVSASVSLYLSKDYLQKWKDFRNNNLWQNWNFQKSGGFPGFVNFDLKIDIFTPWRL